MKPADFYEMNILLRGILRECNATARSGVDEDGNHLVISFPNAHELWRFMHGFTIGSPIEGQVELTLRTPIMSPFELMRDITVIARLASDSPSRDEHSITDTDETTRRLQAAQQLDSAI